MPETNVITFSWLVPVLIGVIGALFLLLVNQIRLNIKNSMDAVTTSVLNLEKRFNDHSKKMEDGQFDKRISLLEAKQ